MKRYRLESLRSRRAGQGPARRPPWQRRAVVVVVAVVAFAWALLGTGGWAGLRHGHLAQATGRPALVAGLASAGLIRHHAASEGPSLASEVEAVRRLAAAGLPLYCGGGSKRMVALTFDDGPGPYTELAVRKLREFGLHATFFLVGKEIRAWPGRVAVERPLAVFGDHTMTHLFLPALSRAAMDSQIAQAQAMIAHAADEPVVMVRPPYEGHTPMIDAEVRRLGMLEVLWNVDRVRRLGMLEVLWNVDSRDSLGANYAGIERNVIAGLKPGSIILMHENHGQTIRALPTIFNALRRDRLQAVTVPELVAEDPPSPAQLRAGIAGCLVSHRLGNGG